MDYRIGAAAAITSGALAIALAVAGIWLARGGRPHSGDHEHWFLASLILLIVAAADRLTLLDGQLLGLAALLLLWWNAMKGKERSGKGDLNLTTKPGIREADTEPLWAKCRASPHTKTIRDPNQPLRSRVLARCGFGVLLTVTAGLGLLTIALVVTEFVSALRSAPGGWAALSWFDSLAIVAEVARSRPSLRGLSVLAPSAWLAGVVAVVTLWITVLPAPAGRIISRLAGAALVGGGLVVAARLVFQ